VKKAPTSKASSQLGPVMANAVYPMREFGRLLDLHDKALADAQKQGLKTIKFGRQKFILGRDGLAFFQELADRQGTND
jgi:hypothetical protein